MSELLLVEPVSALRRRHQEREASGGLSFAWQDILPDGGVLFGHVGQPKIGKTTFGYILARTAGRGGGKMLGREVKARRVLVMALEDPAYFTEALADRYFEDGNDVLFFTDRVKANADGLTRIVETIKANAIGLVILSSLSVFWEVVDENDNARVQRAGELIRDAARLSGVPWLLDIHSRKGEGSEGAQIRGASALAGVIDGWISQSRGARKSGEKDTRRYFEVRGRLPRGGLDITADFDSETGTYTVVEGEKGLDPDTANRCRLIAASHEGRVRFTVLLKELGLRDGGKYRQALKKALLADGWRLVEERGSSVWVVS